MRNSLESLPLSAPATPRPQPHRDPSHKTVSAAPKRGRGPELSAGRSRAACVRRAQQPPPSSKPRSCARRCAHPAHHRPLVQPLGEEPEQDGAPGHAVPPSCLPPVSTLRDLAAETHPLLLRCLTLTPTGCSQQRDLLLCHGHRQQGGLQPRACWPLACPHGWSQAPSLLHPTLHAFVQFL